MDQVLRSPVTSLVRRMSGVAAGGLAVVGAFEMRSYLVFAVLSVGGFAFIATVLAMWQTSEVSRGRATSVAAMAVVILLAVAGVLAALDDLHVVTGFLALGLAGLLRHARPRPGAPDDGGLAPASAEEVDEALRSLASRPRGNGLRGSEMRGLVREETAEQVVQLVRDLDGPALHRLWADCRAEGARIEPTEQVRLAALRQIVLDEIERRAPARFDDWLARGAPADDPSLDLRRPGSPA